MQRFISIFLFLIMCGCAHQDLKAPYELGEFYPVIDQWSDTDAEQEKNK